MRWRGIVMTLDSNIVRVYGLPMDRSRRIAPTVDAPRRDELTRPRYIISIAAELASCHPRTLRIYEEEGLLQPQRRNNLRLYSEADIKRVRIIRFLTRRQRVNLAGVRVILQLEALGKIRVYDLFDEDDVERFADDVSDEPALAEGATRRGN
jgi:MerR family transcriptional regulator/heat shock protein HspR